MNVERISQYSVIFIAIVVLAFALQTFQSVLRPLTIAILLSFLIVPFQEYLKKKRIPGWLAFVGILVGLVIVIGLVSSLLLKETGQTADVDAQFTAQLDTFVESAADVGLDLSAVKERAGTFIGKAFTSLVFGIKNLFGELLFVVVYLLFIIPSHNEFMRRKNKRFKRTQQTLMKIEDGVRGYLSTKTLVSLGTALVSMGILLAFDASFVMFSTILIFLLNFIPIIGSILAVVLVLIINSLSHGVSMTFGFFALLLFLVQLLFGQIIEPKMAGKRLSISPILIILSLGIWTWIWGVVGALISIPLTVTIKIIIEHFFNA